MLLSELKRRLLARTTLSALEIQILIPASAAQEGAGGMLLTAGQVHYGELALGHGLLEQTPPGSSLNTVSSSYLLINGRPLPPCSCVAGNAIIQAEGNSDALTALVSAKGHERASEPPGLQRPHTPYGKELFLWDNRGAPDNTRDTHY